MSVGKYRFSKLVAEVDSVNRPIIMKEIERLKGREKKSPKLDALINIDRKVQIHPIHFVNLYNFNKKGNIITAFHLLFQNNIKII